MRPLGLRVIVSHLIHRPLCIGAPGSAGFHQRHRTLAKGARAAARLPSTTGTLPAINRVAAAPIDQMLRSTEMLRRMAPSRHKKRQETNDDCPTPPPHRAALRRDTPLPAATPFRSSSTASRRQAPMGRAARADFDRS
jgi:hypothetical protein